MTSTISYVFRIFGLCLIGIAVWTAVVIAVVMLTTDKISATGTDPASLIDAAKRHAADHPGNLAVVVIDNARVRGTYFKSIGRPVNGDTLFQMASVSKWVTAWGVMTLVESGKIDLDAPVSRYLTRWQLPPTGRDNAQVTMRRLLSHTAGLRDGLGYCGFAPGQPIQTLEASLTAASDACPFKNGAVAVTAPPEEWEYSGGGYTLLQLVIEEVSGQSFADYLETAVLNPLGMERSTFRTGAQGASNVAEFYAGDGSQAQHFHYTAAAAASLYSSASDLTLFVAAHSPGPDGILAGRGVLTPESLELMRTSQAMIAGRPHWGLGPRLYAPTRQGGYVIGHDGGNAPAVNTTVRIDPVSGDAIIALSTGGAGLASKLGSAWLRQRVDPADLFDEGFSPFALLVQGWDARYWLFGGSLLILIGGMVQAWRSLRRRSGQAGLAPQD